MDFAAKFDEGLTYPQFLDRHATDEHRRRWDAVHADVALTESQKELLHGFHREMKVLVTAGTWCGDCVNQCPIFAHFEAENDKLRIRYFDRDEHADLAEALSLCGAPRVPSVLFLSEDGFVCGRYGDRTLSKYRQMAADQRVHDALCELPPFRLRLGELGSRGSQVPSQIGGRAIPFAVAGWERDFPRHIQFTQDNGISSISAPRTHRSMTRAQSVSCTPRVWE